MIPKVIHYCWFGQHPLPSSAKKCIESWKTFLPDYEIKEWNETNYDVHSIPYIHEAYESKKYAFVSDYARFDILYRYGGLYFDTDVEVIRSMDDLIGKGGFMGCERDGTEEDSIFRCAVAPGLGLGVSPGHPVYAELLGLYATLHFVNPDGSFNLRTVVDYTTEVLKAHGLENKPGIQKVCDLWIYPVEYFCPVSVDDGKLRITSKTVSIHHYAQSWQSPVRKYGRKLALLLGGEKLKRLLKTVFIR